jgi:COP9 signalosome complex subunit 2
MIQKYRDMLIYMSAVSRNECTDAINAILSTISTTSNNAASGDVLSEVYEITLIALKSSNNERLWFNTNHKLAKLYLETKKFSEVERLIMVLKNSCLNADGSDDMTKGTNLLEISCLEIQLCSITKNFSRMKIIYPKTKKFSAAVSDPRIMGIMREEGGKMYMTENKYTEAFNDLYDAFKSYQLAGNARAKDMLKYVVLASMLAQSDINPFAAQEAMVYCDDKEIVAMKKLREALEANDLKKFEKILKNKQNRIADEPFLMKYIEPLRVQMHKLVLLNLTKPYQKVKLEFLAKELSLSEDEVENLLVSMVLDEKLHAQIDQVSGTVLLGGVGESKSSLKKLDLLSKWADRLTSVNDSMGNRISC